jgi:hypothetical protein
LSEAQGQTLDEVELRISRAYDPGYLAELVTPDGALTSATLGELPVSDLSRVASDVRGYGRRLAQWVFQGDLGNKLLASMVKEKPQVNPRSDASSGSSPATDQVRGGLRFRLWLDPEADVLHGLWWESILNPAEDEPLAISTAFSRYQRVQKPRGKTISERPLRLLMIACNPSGLDHFGLRPIDVSLELSIIKDATSAAAWMLKFDRLIGHVTLDQAQERMMRGYHIAHLLLHVSSEQARNSLLFADPDGAADPVPGEKVARSIVGKGPRQPYLVFLATPLEAVPGGGEEERTPVALAPMFVDAGAQAAVAMQAPVAMRNMQRFTQRFYAVLARTGVVDLAMALARAEIYEEGDWEWTYPVLCMRTPDAQLFLPLPIRLERQLRGIGLS